MRNAVHEFHDEIRAAVLGRARVVDTRDAGVIHDRQRLTLRLEARDELLRVHAQFQDLQRHASRNRRGLIRHVDDAHAAFAEDLQDAVWADVRWLVGRRSRGPRGRCRVVGVHGCQPCESFVRDFHCGCPGQVEATPARAGVRKVFCADVHGPAAVAVPEHPDAFRIEVTG